MKKFVSKIISFLYDPWVNLTFGIVGFLVTIVVFSNYSGFDVISGFIVFLSIMFIDIFCNAFFSLIKKKRNSPHSGENK